MSRFQFHKMGRLFIVFALMLTLLAPVLSPSVVHAATGTTYYISSSGGNDNSNGTSESSPWHSLDKVKALSTTLTGPKSVAQGSTFTVKYGLSEVNQSFYSQEITLSYDADLYEFTGVSSLLGDRIKILEPDKQNIGEIRLVIASLGEGNEISADAEILGLTFRAKPLNITKTGVIAITFAELGNAQGADIVAGLSSMNVEVTAKAKPVIPGDVNDDEKVTVGDLAMIAAHYGKDDTHADWNIIQPYDLKADGKIDIEDLASLAQAILLN